MLSEKGRTVSLLLLIGALLLLLFFLIEAAAGLNDADPALPVSSAPVPAASVPPASVPASLSEAPASVSVLPAEKRLLIPSVLQNPELPNGCEAASLAMVLGYWGYAADKIELAYQYIPREDFEYGTPYELFGGDPALTYPGDPATGMGFYCFPPVLAQGAEAYLAQQAAARGQTDTPESLFEEAAAGSAASLPASLPADAAASSPSGAAVGSSSGLPAGAAAGAPAAPLNVLDATGAGEAALIDYLSRGVPVIVWITLELEPPLRDPALGWTLSGSETFYEPYINLHVAVLYGYDNRYFYLCDPLGSLRRAPREELMESYNALGQMALVLKPQEGATAP